MPPASIFFMVGNANTKGCVHSLDAWLLHGTHSHSEHSSILLRLAGGYAPTSSVEVEHRRCHRHCLFRHVKTCMTHAHTWGKRFPAPPRQGDGKIPCPWKLDFLTLRQHEFFRDNENGDDHLNLPQWKHIDMSRFLVDAAIDMRFNDSCLWDV
jgi:hypothetical protein